MRVVVEGLGRNWLRRNVLLIVVGTVLGLAAFGGMGWLHSRGHRGVPAFLLIAALYYAGLWLSGLAARRWLPLDWDAAYRQLAPLPPDERLRALSRLKEDRRPSVRGAATLLAHSLARSTSTELTPAAPAARGDEAAPAEKETT